MKPLIIVLNPYGTKGGGQTIQEAFLDVIQKAVPLAMVRGLHLPTRRAEIFGRMPLFVLPSGMEVEIKKAALLIYQGIYAPGYIPLTRIAKRYEVPFLIVPRGDFVPSANFYPKVRSAITKKLMWRLFSRKRIAQSIGVAVTSQLELDRLKAAGAIAPRWRIIPDPLLASTGIGSESLTEFSGNPFALYLGRLSTEKNLAFAVKLWPRILQVIPNAELRIVGPDYHPEVRAELEQIIRVLDLKNAVSLVPWVDKNEKVALIRASRCVILPSHFESFGLTVLEALQCVTPVLTSIGTPWAHLPAAAGANLPLDEGYWSKELLRFLGPEKKLHVPSGVARAMLEPSELRNVARNWAEFLHESAPQLFFSEG